jgi:hypothetical protein
MGAAIQFPLLNCGIYYQISEKLTRLLLANTSEYNSHFLLTDLIKCYYGSNLITFKKLVDFKGY